MRCASSSLPGTFFNVYTRYMFLDGVCGCHIVRTTTCSILSFSTSTMLEHAFRNRQNGLTRALVYYCVRFNLLYHNCNKEMRPYSIATLLYSTLVYSTLRYSTLVYSTLLYSTLLYSTLLCSIIPYRTLLYPALPYHTLLYPTLPYPTQFTCVAWT